MGFLYREVPHNSMFYHKVVIILLKLYIHNIFGVLSTICPTDVKQIVRCQIVTTTQVSYVKARCRPICIEYISHTGYISPLDSVI